MLTCRERAGLRLTVYAGTKTWTGALTAAEMRSMASEVGMETNEFIQETERAIKGKPKIKEHFVYDVSHDDGRLQLIWKRHLLSDNIKVSVYSAVL